MTERASTEAVSDEKKTKHTPGPWAVQEIWAQERRKRGLVYAKIVRAADASKDPAASHGIGFAGVYESNDRHRDEILGNAHLIAAAPELKVQAIRFRSWLEAAIGDGEHADRARADLADLEAVLTKAGVLP